MPAPRVRGHAAFRPDRCGTWTADLASAAVRDPGGLAARTDLLAAAYVAGVVLDAAGMGLHHGLCHGLGGRTGIAHGVANAIVLPHVMRFNLEATREAQERFALASLVANVDDRVAFRAWLGFNADRPTKSPSRNADAYASVGVRGEEVIEIARGIRDGRIPVTGTGQGNVRRRAATVRRPRRRVACR